MSSLETVTLSLAKRIPSFKSSNHSIMCPALMSPTRCGVKRRNAEPGPTPGSDGPRICIAPLLAAQHPEHASPQIQLLEEVVALVVDDDEGRKIHDLDAPDRFHAEFGIFHDLDLLDAVFGEIGRGTPDRAEIKATMLLAGLAHRDRAVALRQHHHRAAGRLELIDKGIHPSRRGRAERARGVTFRRLGGTCVINRMVLEIIRQLFAL